MKLFECAHCGGKHALPTSQQAFDEAQQLFEKVVSEKTIAIFGHGRHSMSLETLCRPGKGKMLGVLHYRVPETLKEGYLYGFSGQFDDEFELMGYVPALINYGVMGAHKRATEKILDALGETIATLRDPKDKLALKQRRKMISQALMQDIFSLYRPVTKSGEVLQLRDAWAATTGIPAATGDCCAPKLLQEANKSRYEVLGVAEIFVGSARSQSDQVHGQFSEPCTQKCEPLLGAMLCEEKRSSQ